MTVTISSRQFSTEDRRRLVLEYLEHPHGLKTAFLKANQVGQDQFRRWRAALADGDLDTGQVPGKTVMMTRRDAAEVRRLQAEVDRLSKQLAAEHKVVDAPQIGDGPARGNHFRSRSRQTLIRHHDAGLRGFKLTLSMPVSTE